jgi:hypothetical protein
VPPRIAVRIYTQGIMTKMTVRHIQGEPMERTLAWASRQADMERARAPGNALLVLGGSTPRTG